MSKTPPSTGGAPVADLVARGDPDRWRTAMTAPFGARPGLLALYAWNLEVARAPWVASEPLLAEIRLRWWLDAIAEIYDGRAVRRHPVTEALADAVAGGGLPRALLEQATEARLRDALPEPLPDRIALDIYIDRTSGHLMELAARFLGAEGSALPVIRRFARGAGTAALLRALPTLRARNRDPLPPGLDIAGFARDGLAALADARARRRLVPREVLPALLPGWQAGRILGRVAAEPEAALAPGALEASDARNRATLLWRATTGLW